jgi:hypothetical protein
MVHGSAGEIADRHELLTVRPAGDVHASAGGPPAMTLADQRPHLRKAADLSNVSPDTVRRRFRAGRLPGAGKDAGDPTGTIYIPASALVAWTRHMGIAPGALAQEVDRGVLWGPRDDPRGGLSTTPEN